MLEHEHLKAIAGSEEIDVGDSKTGESFDDLGRIDCPGCNTKMLRMVDARQPHIRYESCPTCYGVLFDAGEFRDYKEETVFDFFRALLAKERT
jgi:hypothetical protein